MTMRRLFTGLAVALSLGAGAGLQAAEVDPGLPEYQKASGVSGNLSSVGSDTLANLMTLWAEQFKR
ncbi:MAG TPA: phosphate-binding protein, partial [Spongiibacteraceae bacterium]|nr:phosphate-binding protein [Spongiibacteraceae bacterium]